MSKKPPVPTDAALTNGNGHTPTTRQALNSIIKSACDILRRSNCAGALQYVPELTWMLFLRILDEREEQEQLEYEAVGREFTPSLETPYRWRDWAAPDSPRRDPSRKTELGDMKNFVNGELLPHLRGLADPKVTPSPTPRQKVIGQVLSGVERVRVDTDNNLMQVLDKIHDIHVEAVDPTHMFALSEVYENLLLKMGEKGNDGGQFFTPREVIRAMVQVIAPRLGETVYDPCCGTGGFLAQVCDYLTRLHREEMTPDQMETLARHTFFGREKEDLIFPIALANLVLHGIDEPHLAHGNTLTGVVAYGGLLAETDTLFDICLTNPPFGGKEGKEAQTLFPFQTSATQVLFIQHVLSSLKNGGRCGIVLDEGVLFRTNETAFVQTKRKLLADCDLWCIASLPGGVFTAAGAGVKTNLLFFTKGRRTERIWYYDLSHIKVGKNTPLTLDKFAEFFQLLPERADGPFSWTVDITARRAEAKKEADPLRARATRLAADAAALRAQLPPLKAQRTAEADAAITDLTERVKALDAEARELSGKAQSIEDAVYDLKAVNPNAVAADEQRTPQELLDFIALKGIEVEAALSRLRSTLATVS